jgi:methionine--tRNA ligase beta chain
MDRIGIDDFSKLDLRVGMIKKVEDHPNADKLLVLRVDLGEEEERTIVAGLKGHYTSEELEGKKAVFVANLEPAQLRGVESNGMIMAASSEGKEEVVFLKPEKDVPVGSKVS